LTENPMPYALNEENLKNHVSEIENVTMKIFDYAKQHNLPVGAAADQLAEEIFLGAGDMKHAANS